MKTLIVTKNGVLISKLSVPADQARGFSDEIQKAGYLVTIE
jgi:hypothetical protein